MGEIRWNSSGIKDFVGKEGVANQPVTINFSNFEIAQVACGAEFSLFLTRCGKVFGVGKYYCVCGSILSQATMVSFFVLINP